MGRCIKCGNQMPWDVGMCTMCKEATERANAQRLYEEHTKRQVEQKRRQEAWEAQHGLKSLRTDSNGNVIREYNDGRTELYTPKQVKHNFWRTVIILILLAVGAFMVIKYLSYSKAEKNLLSPFEILQTESGDGSFVTNTTISESSTYKIYELVVYPEKSGFISNIFASSTGTSKASCFTVDGKTVYRYLFFHYDFNTGLDGEFFLTEINGKRAIIDDDRGKIYYEGSEFFTENIKKLEAFNPTEVFKPLTEKVSGGEYGINSQYYVLKKDGISVSCSEDGSRINALDESGKERLVYKVQYYESSNLKLPDYSDYEEIN